MGNPQNPFSFNPKLQQAKPIVGINYKWDYLPSNYLAICIRCCSPTQKKIARYCKECIKNIHCKKCSKSYPLGSLCNCLNVELKDMPLIPDIYLTPGHCYRCGVPTNTCNKCKTYTVRELQPLPWRVLPPNFRPNVFGTYLQAPVLFKCIVCKLNFGSLAIFSSLCEHDVHSSAAGRWTCRFCCGEVSTKTMGAITRARIKFNKKDTTAEHIQNNINGVYIAPTIRFPNHRSLYDELSNNVMIEALT